MRALGFVAVGLVGCSTVSDDRSFALSGDFRALRVDLANGDLEVEAVAGDEVLVDVDFGGVTRAGAVDRYVDEDGVLVLDYGCGLCGGDVRVGVPDGLPVQAFVAHGDLGLTGLSGPVEAHVRTGALEGEELACDADLFVNAGELSASWSFRPVGVRAEAHVGAIALELPNGGYDLDTRANLGVVRLSDVFHDPEADAGVFAFAHAGEVAITGR